MIKKYLYLLPLLAISASLYNIEIFRIYPFEFDTNVYFTLLESLIRTGKALMPIVAGGLPSICDINLNCSFTHPDIAGQQLFTQMPPDYTSGISLLFIPALINKIISAFYSSKISLIYLIQIYSIGAALIYLLSSILIIRYSKINWHKQIIYIIISFVSQMLIIQYAANGIIGELYASILISNIALILALTINQANSRAFYFVCATFLGIALEAKISSVFPVGAIFSIIVFKNFQQRKFFDIFILIILISLAKFIAVIYYYCIFNFSINNLIVYFKSIEAVYLYNAGAGMGWGNTGIIKQLSLIFLNEKINLIIYAGSICYVVFLFHAVKTKNKALFTLMAFSAYAMFSALIYPTIFKFPYTRILSPFFGLLPLSFLPFLEYLGQIIKNKYFRNGIQVTAMSLLIFSVYHLSPLHFPLFERPPEKIIESFSKSYPDFKSSPSAIFITSHFFGMPWDIYLSGALDNEGPLNSHTLYGDQSLQHKIVGINDAYLIQSCRWGHCSKESQIERRIPSYQGHQASLRCTFIKPADEKTIYKLYECSIKKI